MLCSITQIKNKQVVSMENGTVLGFIADLELDTETGMIDSAILYGKSRMLGLFGREDDLYIPWNCIEVIGEETVLVHGPIQTRSSRSKRFEHTRPIG